MSRKIYAVMMSFFLAAAVLPQRIYAEEETAETTEGITETETVEEPEEGSEQEEEIIPEEIIEEEPAESIPEETDEVIPEEESEEEPAEEAVPETEEDPVIEETEVPEETEEITEPETAEVEETAIPEIEQEEVPEETAEPETITEEETEEITEPELEEIEEPAEVLEETPAETADPETEETVEETVNETTGTEAVDDVFGDFEYSSNGSEMTITKYTGSATEAIIPSDINGLPVTCIDYSAFENCSSLTIITIPDSVTIIGERAFQNCSALTSITIPDSVTSIGNSAFKYCSSLTSITIPDSVTSLGGTVFTGCSSLKTAGPVGSSSDIEFGWTTSIPANTFNGCNSLTSITIPDSVTSIGHDAFFGCWNLTSITIPDSVTSIGGSAFQLCIGLTGITIPDGVTSIAISTFADCSSLTSITIPDSVTSIGDSAFSGCSRLTSIAIPAGVTSIGDSAFSDCGSLTSITISDSVTSIGDSAFSDCGRLTSITIPDSVTSIGHDAFFRCWDLTSITIPASVTSIGDNAFGDCSNLTIFGYQNSAAQTYADNNGIPFVDLGNVARDFDYSSDGSSITIIYYHGSDTEVIIPSEIDGLPVTSIGMCAFRNHHEVVKVTIPDSVTSMSDFVFEGCESLNKVIIESDNISMSEWIFSSDNTELKTAGPIGSGANIEFGWKTMIPNNAFWGAECLQSITIPDTVTSIGESAFKKTGIVSITLPDSIQSIGDYVFEGCSRLTEVDLPAGLTKLSNLMFSECSSLTSFVVPDSVTEIGDQAFGSTGLSSIIIPASVTVMGDTVFAGCLNLKTAGPIGSGSNIEFGWETEIPVGTFRDHTHLVSVSLPDTLTHIGEETFDSCSSLTDIRIPGSVTSIDDQAFFCCVGLTNLEIPYGVTKIGSITFSNCNNLTSVTIPESVVSIGQGAFLDCPSLLDIIIPASVTSISKHAVGYRMNGTAPMSIIEGFKIHGYTGTAAEAYANENGIQFVNLLNPTALNSSNVGSIPAKTYNGTAWKPAVTVTVDGTVLTKGTDYTVSYKNNTNAGTASAIVKGIGKYTGTITRNFTIKPKAIELSAEVTEVYAYDGTAKKPDIEVTDGVLLLSKGTDYTVAYKDNINAGTASVIVTGKGNYTGTVTKYFTIEPIEITPAVTLTTNVYTYDGKAKTPGVTVKDGDTALVKDTDYTVAYPSGRVNAGTYTVKVTLKGNYSGTKSVSFKINKAAQTLTVKAAAASVSVGKTTTVSVTGNKGTVSYKSADTTIAAVSTTGKITAKKVGTVKITVASAATSNYKEASRTVTIKVVPAATASVTAENLATGMKVKWKKVAGATGYRVYRNGTQIKKITSGSTVIYTDTKANTNGTKYTYKIVAYAATGKSTLSKSVTTYKVAQPKISSLANTAAGKLTVKWAKNAKATGYQIQYSTSPEFTKATTKTITVTKNTTVSKEITKLSKGKTYYVRVRSYRTVGTAKYYSSWSLLKKKQVTK